MPFRRKVTNLNVHLCCHFPHPHPAPASAVAFLRTLCFLFTIERMPAKSQSSESYFWNAAFVFVCSTLEKWLKTQKPFFFFALWLFLTVLWYLTDFGCSLFLKIPEKKKVVKKDNSISSVKNQKHPESTQGIKEKDIWKSETPQVRTDLFKDLRLLFAL